MYRPELNWAEDGLDHRLTGYLTVIDDVTSIMRTLTEFMSELGRKEAVRYDEYIAGGQHER